MPGIGLVDQNTYFKNPAPLVNELHVRTNPFPRSNMGAAYMNGRIWLLGGIQSRDRIYQDTWYRDDEIPTTDIVEKPKTKTTTQNI